MVEFSKDIETKIASFLKGESSPEEAMELMAWKEATEENNALFVELEKVFNLAHGQRKYVNPPVDQAWDTVLTQIQPKKGNVISLGNYKRQFIAVAAILLVAMLTMVIWKTRTDFSELHSGIKTMEKDGDVKSRVLLGTTNVQSFILSDESEIKLSKGSELVLDKNFNTKDRRLRLKGSAEFHVIHDENKPFVVSVNSLKIIDLGTVFKVDSKGDTVKISVSEGAVELRLNDQLISMKEGDSAFYLIEKEVISRYKTKKQRKNKVFAFDGTQLKDVVSVLSEFFEQSIIIKNRDIEDCPLTVTFKNENLITILDIIKELMDVKIVQNKKTIEIYGKGCN